MSTIPKRPITEVIQQRFSCRTYQRTPIAPSLRQQLVDLVALQRTGPLGSQARFALISATESDRAALKGLGTYGIIRDPAGFILGAVKRGPRHLEDLGYLMEYIVLYATSLNLGTCWLGGTFTRSSFAARMDLTAQEELPAVVSVGHIAERPGLVDRITRRVAKGDQRRPWEQLFFGSGFDAPLSPAQAGPFADALEMVRLGPSASNRQPWRIVRTTGGWHFYLRRTRGYANRNQQIMLADLQRVDMGIAMCHFALTAGEASLTGRWAVNDPLLTVPNELTEYIVSWVADD